VLDTDEEVWDWMNNSNSSQNLLKYQSCEKKDRFAEHIKMSETLSLIATIHNYNIKTTNKQYL